MNLDQQAVSTGGDGSKAEGLIEAGEFHPFYVRLSDIVRRYVEERFGLMAPQRSTPEFLREARGSSALSDDHQDLLARFLRAADMVKFALHVPAAADAEGALTAARGFVEDTMPSEPGAPVEAAA